MKRRCSSAGPSDPLLSLDDVTTEERNYHLPTFVLFDTIVFGFKDPPPIPSFSRCIASLWGELFGTILLIAVGCSVVSGGQPILTCGFTFGLLLLILIMIFEPISGAKFNPVVSLVFFIENTFLIIPNKLLGHYCQNLEVQVANNKNIQNIGNYGSNSRSNVEVLTAIGGLDETEKSSEFKIRHYLFFFVFMLIECIIQMIGCTIGAYIVKGMIPGAAKYVYGATLLAEGVTPLNGIMLEFFMTFFLLYVIFMLDFNYNIHFVPKKEKKTKQKDLIRKTQLTATTVAGVIVILTWLGGQWTGTSLNPARSFGPAFVAWNWESHWIFWVGPPAGGILAWIVWRTFTVFALLNKK